MWVDHTHTRFKSCDICGTHISSYFFKTENSSFFFLFFFIKLFLLLFVASDDLHTCTPLPVLSKARTALYLLLFTFTDEWHELFHINIKTNTEAATKHMHNEQLDQKTVLIILKKSKFVVARNTCKPILRPDKRR